MTSVAHPHSGWFIVSHASFLAYSTESRLQEIIKATYLVINGLGVTELINGLS